MSIVIMSLSTLTLILVVIYLLSKRKFDYWKKKNVPHLKPIPILGNYGGYILMKKYIGHVTQEICQAFPNEPVIGAYYGTEPTLIVQDPELIKLITTKDFYYFNGREVAQHTHKEINTQNIFFTYGDRWKVIRKSLSPIFSSAKMKMMFHLIQKCSAQFEKMLEEETKIFDVVEVRALSARYTMGCICSCGFGIDTDIMEKGRGDNAFRIMGNMIFETSAARGISIIARAIWPAIFYGLRLRLFSKTITDFFNKLLTDVYKVRDYKPTSRNDFVDMLLNLKLNETITCESLTDAKSISKKVDLKIDDNFLVAQSIAFFAAGYETSANTMSLTLYELSKNKEIQIRALEDVDAYLRKNEGKIDYECINEVPYLDACVNEVMRMYPVLGVITREVMEDYTLPSGLHLDKGVRVHLPIYHLHHHPEHFPEPELFRPERFVGEEKNNIKPYTFMPFGEGPRICIGMRLAKMQVLTGLITVLKNYQVEATEDTPRSVGIEPRNFVFQPTTALNVKLIRR